MALPLFLAVACTGAARDGDAAFLETASQVAPTFAPNASEDELLEVGRRLCASADAEGEGEVVAIGSGRFVGQDELTGLWQAALEHLCPEKQPAQ